MRSGLVWRAFARFLLFALLLGACDADKPVPGGSRATITAAALAASASARPPPAPPITLVVAYGSEKRTWLEEQAAAFKATSPRTRSGRPIVLDTRVMGSGEAVAAIASGALKPHVFSPASSLYLGLLNAAWAKRGTRPVKIAPAGDPLVLSPLVVAIWRPMAEALGWPKKALGWADLIRINADKKGWGALGHPEWGRFKLGHTHPEFSNSGLLSVVAEAYAGARKTRGLDEADLDRKEVLAFVSSVEETIVHYGKSTGFFADKMLSRGPGYLSAAVLYENLVIESYAKKSDAPFPIVAIYPREGTFWSDHPYAVLDAPWVGPEEREASQALLAFLKARPAQLRALSLGFRPADPTIAMAAPIDAAHGVDPKQPETLLEVPEGPTIDKLLGAWSRAKKASDVIVAFDTSGSMAGKPLAEAKSGAKAFLGTLGDRDEASLLFFSTRVYPILGPKKIGDVRADFAGRVDAQIADGRTALYDAIAQAWDAAEQRAEKEPARIHAVVVMTDGQDEGSKLTLPILLQRIGKGKAEESDVKVFTIGYGDDADLKVLGKIAEAARGTTAKGTTATIVEVFKDMAAFF